MLVTQDNFNEVMLDIASVRDVAMDTETQGKTKLSRLRAKTGRSLEKVARELNNTGFTCSVASLIRWEGGASMKVDTARALASYYGVKVDEVVDL